MFRRRQGRNAEGGQGANRNTGLTGTNAWPLVYLMVKLIFIGRSPSLMIRPHYTVHYTEGVLSGFIVARLPVGAAIFFTTG